MTASIQRRSSLSRRRRPPSPKISLVDAGPEDLAAVHVGKEALDETGSVRLVALIEARDRREHPEELRPAGRNLRGERPSLRDMRAVSPIVSLANIIDRNAFRRAGVRCVDEARKIEVVG